MFRNPRRGGGSSIDEGTEVPEENLNTEDDSIVIPEETPPDHEEPDIPEVSIEPEEPQFSDDVVTNENVDVPSNEPQGTEEEVVEEVTPTVTPTEVPEEGVKDITFVFGECKYGSTVSFMDSEDNTIATIRTEDGDSTVEYSGVSSVNGSSVTLEDVEETDFHILSDNDMMGSDVSEFSVICDDGTVIKNNMYEDPFWVISEEFTLDSSATVHMSFVNNSFVSDEMLDKIDQQPELMSEEENYSVQTYALPEEKAIQGKAMVEKGDEVFRYPWTSACGTNEFLIRHGNSGDKDYWSARGVCAQAHLNAPAMGIYDYQDWYADKEYMTHPTNDSRRTIILLMLMLPGNNLEEVGKQVWKYNNREYLFSLCHGAISWINAGTLTPDAAAIDPSGKPVGLDPVIIEGIKNKYGKTMTAINKEICMLATTTHKDTVDKYNLYLLKCGDGTRQNVCFVRRKPAPKLGYITVKKTSGNTAMTNQWK